MWKTVDNLGDEEPIESGNDGTSDSRVVETLEVNGRKLLDTDSDVSLVLSTMVYFVVGAVNISDVDRAVLLTLKEDEGVVSPGEEVAREMLPDKVCSLCKKKRVDVLTTVISLTSGFHDLSLVVLRRFRHVLSRCTGAGVLGCPSSPVVMILLR